MTDETRTDAETPEAPHDHDRDHNHDRAESATEEAPAKLHQDVEIRDAGPCKKHIKVTVNRDDIDARFEDKYKELARDNRSFVRGFRPGKAPRSLLVRHYQKEVKEQVRAEVLMASLEQLAEDNNLSPLAPPDINPGQIVIPDAGPMVYEFDVEVRPEFELPNYKGLKLKRPTKAFTDEDVEAEEKRLLENYGQIVPKEDGSVVLGDIITADLTTRYNGQVIHTVPEARIRVENRLVLRDGVAENFGHVVKGAKVGDTRSVDITLSESVADANLRGKTVQVEFAVKDLKTVRLPELSDDLLERFGVSSREQLHELIRVLLERRLEYQQRQSARQQVLAQIGEARQWELPQDLLMRQARRTLARRVMEMRNSGMPEDEIAARQRILQQDVLHSTASALKEHFVLQKIAEDEKLEIQEEDIEEEIERLAARNNESPRKVRARLEKEDLIETLAMELLERKALDLVLGSAEYEDVPLDPAEAESASVATAEAQLTPGELRAPEAQGEAEAKPAEEAPQEAPKAE